MASMALTLLLAVVAMAVDLDGLLLQMDAPDWRQRESATMALARRVHDISPAMLEQRLESTLLTPEQRARVLLALQRRFYLLPRAAMGVRMAPEALDAEGVDAPDHGVLVTRITPGLAVDGLLFAGDVVTHLNDTAINRSSALVEFVQSRFPGAVVRIRVMRPTVEQGELTTWTAIDIEVKLGSIEAFAREDRPAVLVTDAQRRLVERLRRTHAPRGRVLFRTMEPGRGSPRWIASEVERTRAQLGDHPDATDKARAMAQWRTWLRVVESRMGDRFLSDDQRRSLEMAQDALQRAISNVEQ